MHLVVCDEMVKNRRLQEEIHQLRKWTELQFSLGSKRDQVSASSEEEAEVPIARPSLEEAEVPVARPSLEEAEVPIVRPSLEEAEVDEIDEIPVYLLKKEG